jgi:hypothetical protein
MNKLKDRIAFQRPLLENEKRKTNTNCRRQFVVFRGTGVCARS